LLNIINDILDFSKIEAGKLDLENQPYSLQDVIEETIALLDSRAAEKGLQLLADIDPLLPDKLFGDAAAPAAGAGEPDWQCNQVHHRSQVTVSVSGHGPGVHDRRKAKRIDSPPLFQLRFAVRDTGIGIPPSRMEKYFRPSATGYFYHAALWRHRFRVGDQPQAGGINGRAYLGAEQRHTWEWLNLLLYPDSPGRIA